MENCILNKYFDKIYCINLDRRIDRWNRCKFIFKNFNLKVERISAIDAYNINHLKGKNKIYYANLHSHYIAIKKAKELNLNNVLILEDDFEFIDNFKIELENLPLDWDMLYLGGLIKGHKKNISKNIIKSDKIISCHSYAINSKSFDFIIEKMKILNTLPVDSFYPLYQKYLNSYILNPSITYQRNSFSDIDLKINTNKRSFLDKI